ncbi:MAG: DEAD/DEAH box helicase [Acetobacteraceae bacterium]
MPKLGLRLTPHGRLILEAQDDLAEIDPETSARLTEAFAQGVGHGLVQLGAAQVGRALPPVFVWWRGFAAQYIGAVCLHASTLEASDGGMLPAVPAPTAAQLSSLLLTAPMMAGGEYLTQEVLLGLWDQTAEAFAVAFGAARTGLQGFLTKLNPAWNLVGRVHFNLAENRSDPEQPFAFMATYTTRLSAQAKAQHVPLGQALREYAGAANRTKLLSLLLPVQRAARQCAWLKPMIDSGEIFHPLRWGPAEAWRILRDVPELEGAGIVVRMPASWRANRPARPQVTATVGSRVPSALGVDGLLDFRVGVTLDGAPLTEAEVASMLAGTENLVLLRGQWVEVDRARLQRTMEQFRAAEELAARDGLTFAAAMRMLAGAAVAGDDPAQPDSEWTRVRAGAWLERTLQELRAPNEGTVDPGPALHGTLRPYQITGLHWMHLLSGLGLGACLADDMGLGKTIQVLSLLLVDQSRNATPRPSLLVVPASLLGNWAAEIQKFAPDLKAVIVHPSAMPPEEVRAITAERAGECDLAITSYGSLLRIPLFAEADWRLVILDEAQAIKNPNARQTKAAKALKARARIALTGTPVENHLGDLWSIFDFINPGLLGNAKEFTRYTKGLAGRTHNPYGPLRELVRPYILRRMKTDKSVIADLPDKTEVKALCGLSRRQAALYGQAVADLAESLEEAEGMQRTGIVLAMLMRLKQICNHPSQWLNDHVWAEEDSGKWARLREIGEVIAARQEKMLVFTQFREMTAPLAAFLGQVFGRAGLVLHGTTAVKERRLLVQRFQDDEAVPFFVLSLKAGGSGLSLTAASHVVHFDRWWNPAVEDQATDRAFRIGQKKNVLVHKFICRGTVEEKIDTLIDSKRGLSDELLAGRDEVNLTEMTNDEIMQMVSLDLHAAMKE